MADEYHGGGPRGAPHGLLLAVVVGLVVAGPLFLGDGGLTEVVAELLSPVGLLLLPVCLLLLIRLLSSDRGAAALADVFAFGGSPDAVHRVGGSPVGIALVLLLILTLLYYRSTLFGGDGDDDE
jgi:ABC-type Co2+ transport system permease subunit